MARKETVVTWQERRENDMLVFRAEGSPGDWTFLSRSTCEVLWQPEAATEDLIAKADSEFKERQGGKN